MFSPVSLQLPVRRPVTLLLGERPLPASKAPCFGSADQTLEQLITQMIESTQSRAVSGNIDDAAQAGSSPLFHFTQTLKTMTTDGKVLAMATALSELGKYDPRRWLRSEPTSDYLQRCGEQGRWGFLRGPLSYAKQAEVLALGRLAHTLEQALLQEPDQDCLLVLHAFGLGEDWQQTLQSPSDTGQKLWWLLVQNNNYTAPDALKQKIARLKSDTAALDHATAV